MTKRLATLTCWILALALGAVLVVGAASGQTTRPATQPTTQPSPAFEQWTPRTVLRAGGRYLLPETPTAVDINVDVDDVWLVGGCVYSSSAGPAIETRAARCKILGVRFRKPGAKAWGYLGVGPCVQDRGRDTRVVDCTADDVDQAVRATEGSVGLAVIGLRSGEGLRANALYADGARDFVFALNQVMGSQAEIPVRMSPSGRATSSRGVVALNELHNDEAVDDKGVLDVRQATDVMVAFNGLFSQQGVTAKGVVMSGTAASTGPPVDGDHPPLPWQESRRVYFVGNDCYRGHIEVRNAAKQTVVLDNRVWEQRRGIDVVVYVTGYGGALPGQPPLVVEAPIIRRNVGYVDGPTSKPPVRVTHPEVIKDYDEKDNRWVDVAATPTTQPAVTR